MHERLTWPAAFHQASNAFCIRGEVVVKFAGLHDRVVKDNREIGGHVFERGVGEVGRNWRYTDGFDSFAIFVFAKTCEPVDVVVFGECCRHGERDLAGWTRDQDLLTFDTARGFTHVLNSFGWCAFC